MSLESLDAVADGFHQMTWMANSAGMLTFLNRRCLDYFGLAQEDLRGWDWHWAIDPRDLLRVRRAWQHALRAQAAYHINFRLRRADGVYRWHASSVFPLRDASGQVARWFGMCVDIDDQKTARLRPVPARRAS